MLCIICLSTYSSKRVDQARCKKQNKVGPFETNLDFNVHKVDISKHRLNA